MFKVVRTRPGVAERLGDPRYPWEWFRPQRTPQPRIRIQTATDLDLDPSMVSTTLGTATLESIERASVSWQRNAVRGGTVDARDWVKALRYANLSEQRVTFLGGHGRDRATGGERVDVLRGSDGDDVLRGMSGKDTLIGGRGSDVCDGGPGKDVLRTCER